MEGSSVSADADPIIMMRRLTAPVGRFMEGFTALKEVYSIQLYLKIECGVSYSLHKPHLPELSISSSS
jgi:hypothetical protein